MGPLQQPIPIVVNYKILLYTLESPNPVDTIKGCSYCLLLASYQDDPAALWGEQSLHIHNQQFVQFVVICVAIKLVVYTGFICALQELTHLLQLWIIFMCFHEIQFIQLLFISIWLIAGAITSSTCYVNKNDIAPNRYSHLQQY